MNSHSVQVEEWATFLDTQHWDNLDELAEIIVSALEKR
jgi:hypothetical protein